MMAGIIPFNRFNAIEDPTRYFDMMDDFFNFGNSLAHHSMQAGTFKMDVQDNKDDKARLRTVLTELFAVDLAVLHPETNPLAAAVMLLLAVLLAFYFWHYFFLENTVQRWYKLADKLQRALNDAP